VGAGGGWCGNVMGREGSDRDRKLCASKVWRILAQDRIYRRGLSDEPEE